MSDNPLLDLEFEIPFDRIEAEHVRPAIDALLEDATKKVDAIAKSSDARTFANTMDALDDATEPLELAMTVVGHLESVATTDELRAAYNEVKPKVSAFYASLPLNGELYAALTSYAATDDAKALTGERKRFVEKSIEDFERHGAKLPEDGKKRLDEITRELAELTAKYGQNVLDETAAFELIIDDEAQLAGLPDSAKEAAAASAKEKEKTGWRLTLQAPSLIPSLTYLDDASIREKLYRAYNTRASAGERANPPLIARILELRAEKAKLLGYDDFADLVLADRMAKNGKSAVDFVRDLEKRTREAFDKENAALEAFKGSALQPWDLGYYSEKQRKKLYDFDEEALRPYFSLERVVEGMFETVKRLYGISVRENKTMPVWHETVKVYDLVDEDGSSLGSFYSDMFPREEKRGGAWMNGFVSGILRDGKVGKHLGLICGNLTPPVGDKPSLLLHYEVETLFHEFGHLLHHLLSARGDPEHWPARTWPGTGSSCRQSDHGELVLGEGGARPLRAALGDGRADPGRPVRQDEPRADVSRSLCADAPARVRDRRSRAARRVRPGEGRRRRQLLAEHHAEVLAGDVPRRLRVHLRLLASVLERRRLRGGLLLVQVGGGSRRGRVHALQEGRRVQPRRRQGVPRSDPRAR